MYDYVNEYILVLFKGQFSKMYFCKNFKSCYSDFVFETMSG